MIDSVKAGVIGWPIEHSLSPRLHGYWLKHYGINGSYEALAVEPGRLQKSLRALPGQGFRGANLTIPHKEAALRLMDHADITAEKIGAVNTVVVRKDGTLEGRNTDAFGFTQNLLSSGFKPDKKPAVVLGAGGAACAVIAALLDMGFCEIRLANRTHNRAEALAKKWGKAVHVVPWNDANKALKDACLLVNATSLGMQGKPRVELTLNELPDTATVTDLVYAPLITDLLKRAQRRGNTVIDGLGMLLHQARPAFAAFFGRDPEVTPALRKFVLEGK